MGKVNVSDYAQKIYDYSNDTILDLIKRFTDQRDSTLVYTFYKAFCIHLVNIIMYKEEEAFERLNDEYLIKVLEFFKDNSSNLNEDILTDITSFYKTSYDLIKTLDFKNLNDRYELRHHLIDAFNLLRIILERKSETHIREDIFDNYISKFVDELDYIIEYANKNDVM